MKSNLDYLMALSLAYASYTMATCPCETQALSFRGVPLAGVPLAYVISWEY